MFEDQALPSSPPRVIAIDGDSLTRRMLHQRFAGSGYQFATAADGNTAVEFCARLKPDVIVLGAIEPPGIVRSLLGQLQHAHPQAPVILIARPESPLASTAELRRTVFATLSMPLDIARLDQLIARALHWRSLSAALPTYSGQTSSVPDPASTPAEPVTNWQAFVASRIAAGSQALHAEGFAVMERQVMSRVLAHTAGNQARAARILGITRGHLRKKIRLLGIPLPGNPRASRATSDKLATGLT
jgi:DNA-binding NtrC family response regulator